MEYYNPLLDTHLRGYLEKPCMRRHLKFLGLDDGEEVPSKNAVYARHQHMMSLLNRNKERHLAQLSDLSRKLEAVEKVETYRRIKKNGLLKNPHIRTLKRPMTSHDRAVIERIESNYRNSDEMKKRHKNVYEKLFSQSDKYNYLHKLDDLTLTEYKESLKNQVAKMEKIRDLTPWNTSSAIKRFNSSETSWFFKPKSLPNLAHSFTRSEGQFPVKSLNKENKKINRNQNENNTVFGNKRLQNVVEGSRLPPLARLPRKQKPNYMAQKLAPMSNKFPSLIVSSDENNKKEPDILIIDDNDKDNKKDNEEDSELDDKNTEIKVVEKRSVSEEEQPIENTIKNNDEDIIGNESVVDNLSNEEKIDDNNTIEENINQDKDNNTNDITLEEKKIDNEEEFESDEKVIKNELEDNSYENNLNEENNSKRNSIETNTSDNSNIAKQDNMDIYENNEKEHYESEFSDENSEEDYNNEDEEEDEEDEDEEKDTNNEEHYDNTNTEVDNILFDNTNDEKNSNILNLEEDKMHENDKQNNIQSDEDSEVEFHNSFVIKKDDNTENKNYESEEDLIDLNSPHDITNENEEKLDQDFKNIENEINSSEGKKNDIMDLSSENENNNKHEFDGNVLISETQSNQTDDEESLPAENNSLQRADTLHDNISVDDEYNNLENHSQNINYVDKQLDEDNVIDETKINGTQKMTDDSINHDYEENSSDVEDEKSEDESIHTSGSTELENSNDTDEENSHEISSTDNKSEKTSPEMTNNLKQNSQNFQQTNKDENNIFISPSIKIQSPSEAGDVSDQ
ncbi:Hypothetical protein SRAE_1000128000 [Strongyloides ratti]|uniref:Uncharacterized protein n=1 Tax=Strongyloides ratti TaxID=34506 RepID=A0A090L667_STRRB|nr:Hypothetical protein SRAE_1000128000 [Strongyloides ratti]CEF63014.1 Hypothetical protein SRAE_1000128000 [Strongyloides ratti]